jgi:hypothetical protein
VVKKVNREEQVEQGVCPQAEVEEAPGALIERH